LIYKKGDTVHMLNQPGARLTVTSEDMYSKTVYTFDAITGEVNVTQTFKDDPQVYEYHFKFSKSCTDVLPERVQGRLDFLRVMAL